MHYYKRNIGDYAKKAGRLSMLEHGAYTLLLDACYDRERFPTEGEALEWCWARTDAEVAAVRFVLDRFFDLVDGVYVQNRIAEEVARFKENGRINSRIATEREAKRTKRAAESTKRARTVNAPFTLEHGPTTLEHEPPPNQEPLTTNHSLEPNGSVASKLPTCQHQKVIDLYHEKLPELPAVRLLSDTRKRAIQNFWKWVLTSKRSDGQTRATNAAEALEWIGNYFTRASDNDFLMGRSNRSGSHMNWTCDLDFLLTERGKKHVIERTLLAA